MSSPPPWRPRLVQEGKPLYGVGDNDHSMDEAEQRQAAPPATTIPRTHAAASTQQKSARPSSLAKAAGGTLPIRKPHISTKLTIEETFSDDAMAESPPQHLPLSPPRKAPSSPLRMRLVVGEETQNQQQQHEAFHYQHVAQPQHQQHTTAPHHDHVSQFETVERMEGVEHQGPRGPLVVMDGANIAYAYADAMLGFQQQGNARTEPDARGILIAANYFLQMNVRVLVVIPAPWFRAKPRPGDESQGNAIMETPQLEALKDLKARGLLVAAPPRDDDDAYALTIARREDARSHSRGGAGGFVLSCDLFRDAVNRDASGDLREWLTKGSGNGPGRISFAFCDMGSYNDFGDREMDLVPNPRHPLVEWIEGELRKKSRNDNGRYY